MRNGNPLVALFDKMARHRLLFLVVVGACTSFFTLYGYGLSWLSFFILAGTIMLLSLYAGLIWFWKGVFGSLLNRDR